MRADLPLLNLAVTFRPRFLKSCALALLTVAFLCVTSFAQTITGIVTNKTTGKVSAGDDVVLLKLAQGMQELTRTKTDARGRFSLKVPEEGAGVLPMLRVTHDRANYFHAVPPGTKSVEVEVYSGAPEVAGITLAEDVMQIQTEPGNASLRVVEHFLVKNDSSPATTLFSDHPFELNLPPGATVEGGAAKGPGAQSMAVQSPLVPLGEPNHYTIIFPIRPGETEFHIWYHVPYKDSFTFHPRPVLATDNLAIMMPKSMTFKPGAGTPFTAVTEDVGGQAQAFVARNAVPSEPLEFTVSGTGQLPRETPGTQGGAGAQTAATTAGGDPNTDTRPGGGLGVPVDKDAERDPWTKYRWWIIAGFGLAFAAAAGFMLKTPSRPPTGKSGPEGALQALRDEMFALETDRLGGRLSDPQYAELKAAYDAVLRRALERTGHTTGTVQVVPE